MIAVPLWCMHIPGPDEVFATPDRETANRRADEHNAWVDRMFWEGRVEFGGYWPERISVAAVVIKWPHDPESHARDVLTNVFAGKP